MVVNEKAKEKEKTVEKEKAAEKEMAEGAEKVSRQGVAWVLMPRVGAKLGRRTMGLEIARRGMPTNQAEAHTTGVIILR